MGEWQQAGTWSPCYMGRVCVLEGLAKEEGHGGVGLTALGHPIHDECATTSQGELTTATHALIRSVHDGLPRWVRIRLRPWLRPKAPLPPLDSPAVVGNPR